MAGHRWWWHVETVGVGGEELRGDFQPCYPAHCTHPKPLHSLASVTRLGVTAEDEYEGWWQRVRLRTTVCVNLANVMEKADEQAR